MSKKVKGSRPMRNNPTAALANMEIGEKPSLQWVALALIRVDHSYQRAVKPAMVSKILKKFSWALFGAIMLVEHEDGTFTVYDGQHRVEAARIHPLVTEVPALVVRIDMSYEEAAAFLGVNVNRTAITTVEKYYAGIEAGDESMMQVCAVLQEAGCDVVAPDTKSAAPGRTSSVAAIQRAIRSYGDKAVIEALVTLRNAWPKDANALGGIHIQALARLYRNNRNVINRDRMQTKLFGKDRQILAADAEAMRRISGGDASLALAKTIVEIYNRELSKNMISIGEKR